MRPPAGGPREVPKPASFAAGIPWRGLPGEHGLKQGDRRATRWTLIALGAAAVVGVLMALLFLGIWTEHVAGFEPEYSRERGLAWGGAMQRKLELWVDRFLDEDVDNAALRWRETLPLYLASSFDREENLRPGLRPAVLELREHSGDGSGLWTTVAKMGEGDDGYPDAAAFDLDSDSGLRIAVETEDEIVKVSIEGPIEAEAPVRGHYRFRCRLEFTPFRKLLDRVFDYAAILVLIYLAMLYAIFIAVYFIGRREVSLAFSAKEKEIRLKAIASVAEGIAHEVRNPLNAISLNVQFLERISNKPGSEPSPTDYQRVYVELGKIRKIIDNFVGFAKLRDIELSEWRLTDALEDALDPWRSHLDEYGIELRSHARGESEVSGDRQKIVMVLSNLIRNAMDAVQDSEEKLLRVSVDGGRREVRVTIRDSGETPSENVLQNMFDPYFTTRSSALGLGLTLAKTVVESHGGSIEAAVAQGGGCVVTLVMPKQF